MDDGEGRPVLTGLLALVGVAVAVGLILGFVALVGTKFLGLDNAADSTGTTAERWRTEVAHYLPLIARIIAQSERRVLNGDTVPAGDKLVSLFEPMPTSSKAVVRCGTATSSSWLLARAA